MFGSDSSAEKRARVAKQLRDKNGRWIEMGGLVKWYTPNVGESVGKVLDTYDNDTVDVEITSEISRGKTVNVPAGNLTAVKSKATLDTPTVSTSETVNTPISTSEPAVSNFWTEESSKYTVIHPAFKNFPYYNRLEEMGLTAYAFDHNAINGPLRGDPEAAAKRKSSDDYKALISVLDKSPLAEPVTVYRGLRGNAALIQNLEKKGIYFDKAFTSTSTDKAVPHKIITNDDFGHQGDIPIILEFKLPKGFKAHKFDYKMGDKDQYGGRIGMYKNEEEVLLPPEVPFKVLSIEKDNDGVYRAVVEPILTLENSVGVPTDDAAAEQLITNANAPEKKKKKWGLFSLSASELSVGSTLISNYGVTFTKVADELWEYKTNTTKISYNNNSIDSFKLIDLLDFTVETD